MRRRRPVVLLVLAAVLALVVVAVVLQRSRAPERARVDEVGDLRQVFDVLDLGRVLVLRAPGVVVLVDPETAEVRARLPVPDDAVVRGAGSRGFFVAQGSRVARHDLAGRRLWRVEVGAEAEVAAATSTHAVLRSCPTRRRECLQLGVDRAGGTTFRRSVPQDDGRIYDVDGVVPSVGVTMRPTGQPFRFEVTSFDVAGGTEQASAVGSAARVSGRDVVVTSRDQVEVLRDGRRVWRRATSEQVAVSRGLVVVPQPPRLRAYDLDDGGRVADWDLDGRPAPAGSSPAFADVVRGAVVTEDDEDGVAVLRTLRGGEDSALRVPEVDTVALGGGVATLSSPPWWRRLGGDHHRVLRLLDARDGSTAAETRVGDEPRVLFATRPDVAVLTGPSTRLVRAP